jgi:pimeloyl-ACP methyl ester carboxylesterase
LNHSYIFPLIFKFVDTIPPERFITLAESCLTCNTYDRLDSIRKPVLVLGGRKDKIVSGEASEEIAARLGCGIYMYEDLGHSAYEEAKDFNTRILDFLTGGKE